MTILQAIDLRRSRRKYLEKAVEPAVAAQLNAFAKEYAQAADARIELVFDNGKAFDGLRKTYGLLTGVRHYAGLIGPKDDVLAQERLGYYGELFLLQAVALGLGTCWVEGSFDRNGCPFELAEDEQLYCTIAFGHCAEEENFRERMIQSITHRKTKRAEDMMSATGEVPDWFMAGMRAVERAPSAVNKQPWRFTHKDGITSAELVNSKSWVDLGIAKLHFMLGAGSGVWEFGNHGTFKK